MNFVLIVYLKFHISVDYIIKATQTIKNWDKYTANSSLGWFLFHLRFIEYSAGIVFSDGVGVINLFDFSFPPGGFFTNIP